MDTKRSASSNEPAVTSEAEATAYKTGVPAMPHPAPPAPTPPGAPAKKPLAVIFQKADYVCTCGRSMSRKEWVKKRDVPSGEEIFTGEVVVSCDYPKCPNHGRKITAHMIPIPAIEA